MENHNYDNENTSVYPDHSLSKMILFFCMFFQHL